MAEIVTHPYTKWQKSGPMPIPELKNCDPSERHLCTRHFLGVNPPGDTTSHFRCPSADKKPYSNDPRVKKK